MLPNMECSALVLIDDVEQKPCNWSKQEVPLIWAIAFE